MAGSPTWSAAARAAPILASALLVAACGLGTATLRGADGRLAPCAAAHCVSSTETRPDYRVDPLRYSGPQQDAHQKLIGILKSLPRTEVIADREDYVYAQVTSPVMRYVDDVEFVFAAPGVIDLRSSSRIGYYDFGANKNRVELIRAMFTGQR